MVVADFGQRVLIFISSIRKCVIHTWFSILIALTSTVNASGEDPAVDPLSADALVRRALKSEIDGDRAKRQRLLGKALKKQPDNELARWHLGYVKVDSRWVRYDELQRRRVQDDRLVKYRHRRKSTQTTVDDLMKLARWCSTQGLDAEAEAHWMQVLQIQPDHKGAAARLGLRRYGNAWLTPQQVDQMKQQEKEIKLWRPKLRRLRRRGLNGNEEEKQRAIVQLRTISDRCAIPALELDLSAFQPRGKKQRLDMLDLKVAVIDALNRIPDTDATFSLIRHAIWSDEPQVRRNAAEYLSGRPVYDVVPALLGALYLPVELESEVVFRRLGAVTLRQTAITEGRLAKELAVSETRFVGGFVPGNFTVFETLTALREGLDRRADQWAEHQTELLLARNQRVYECLGVVTGEYLPSTPESWWDWWDVTNGYYLADKPTVTKYSYRNKHPYFVSCFAQGTPVVTIDGSKTIEDIRPGDRVLAQNVDTGELAFRSVFRTTLRHQVDLVTVTAGSDEISSTGGHLFWVSGQGWVQARHLQPGQQIHTLDGSSRVKSVEPRAKSSTYNLVVEDFHSYFVGQDKLLVHDVTERRPHRTSVPGLPIDLPRHLARAPAP